MCEPYPIWATGAHVTRAGYRWRLLSPEVMVAAERARTRVAGLLLDRRRRGARADEPPAVGRVCAPVPDRVGPERHLAHHPPRDGCAGVGRAGARPRGPGSGALPARRPARAHRPGTWGPAPDGGTRRPRAAAGVRRAAAARSGSRTDTDRHGPRDPAQPGPAPGSSTSRLTLPICPEGPSCRDAPLIRALIALAVVAGVAVRRPHHPRPARLDLRGGTQIVLETQDSPTVKADRESTDRALEVLRRRVDALGVAEPTPHPLRRPAHHRRTARPAGPARGGRGHRPHGAAHLPPRARRPTPTPTPAPVGVRRRRHPVAEPDRRGRAGRCPTRAASRSGSARPRSPARASTGRRPSIDPQAAAAGTSPSTSKGNGEKAWAELTGTAACRRRATRSAGSRSCWTTR